MMMLMIKNNEASRVLRAIDSGIDAIGYVKDVGIVDVQHRGCEAIISIVGSSYNGDIIKCFPGSKTFFPTNNPILKEFEEMIIRLGYEEIIVLENGTKVKLKDLEIEGIIIGNNLEDCEDEDLADLSYLVSLATTENSAASYVLEVYKDNIIVNLEKESDKEKVFLVPVSWEMSDVLKVKAKTYDEAIEVALSMKLTPGEYIDSSFSVDEESMFYGKEVDEE